MKITTFTIALNQPPKEEKINVTKYQPPQQNKKRKAYNAKERVVYGPYLERVFYNNELAAYEGKAKTADEIKFEFLTAFKHHYTIKKRFKSFKESIGNLQTKYNRRDLYTNQNLVYLLSFRYDRFGYITVNGRLCFTLLTFQEAYRRCLDFKVADPRFVPPELIDKLRERKNSADPNWADWTVPPIKWIESFEKKIGMPAYNSVKFRIGYTREDTPVDCDL